MFGVGCDFDFEFVSIFLLILYSYVPSIFLSVIRTLFSFFNVNVLRPDLNILYVGRYIQICLITISITVYSFHWDQSR